MLHDVLGTVEFDSDDESNRWESEIPWLDDTIGVDITFDGEDMDQRTGPGAAVHDHAVDPE